jgi:hypothetical protein
VEEVEVVVVVKKTRWVVEEVGVGRGGCWKRWVVEEVGVEEVGGGRGGGG